MTQHTDAAAMWKLPYDNSALRERIGDTPIETRSFSAELHALAQDSVDTEPTNRGRWSLLRRRP